MPRDIIVQIVRILTKCMYVAVLSNDHLRGTVDSL